MIGKIKIPRSKIIIIEHINVEILDKSIRTFASGGLFGYLGYFKNDNLGNYQTYITEKKKLTMIITSRNKFIMNCDNILIIKSTITAKTIK